MQKYSENLQKYSYSDQDLKTIYKDLWSGKITKLWNCDHSPYDAFICFDSNMTSEEGIRELMLQSIEWAMKKLYIAIFNAENDKQSIKLYDLIKQLDLGNTFEKVILDYLEYEMTFDRYEKGPFTANPKSYLSSSAKIDFLELFYYGPSGGFTLDNAHYIKLNDPSKVDPKFRAAFYIKEPYFLTLEISNQIKQHQPKPMSLEAFKLRINVNSNQLKMAFNVLEPLLTEKDSPIHAFKVLKEELSGLKRFKNGGQFTIYVHSGISIGQLKNLRKKIFETLSQNNIKPGASLKSDITIDPYMSGRVDRINGKYFEASTFFHGEQHTLNLQNQFLQHLILDGVKDRLQNYANNREVSPNKYRYDIPLLRAFQWTQEDKVDDAKCIIKDLSTPNSNVHTYCKEFSTSNRPSSQGDLGNIMDSAIQAAKNLDMT